MEKERGNMNYIENNGLYYRNHHHGGHHHNGGHHHHGGHNHHDHHHHHGGGWGWGWRLMGRWIFPWKFCWRCVRWAYSWRINGCDRWRLLSSTIPSNLSSAISSTVPSNLFSAISNTISVLNKKKRISSFFV